MRGSRRRRRPAGPQLREQVADGVEIVVRLLVFRGIVARWLALHRQLQILAIGIVDFGNARPAIEHAAERWRARLSVQYAAGRVRKRRGMDRPTGIGLS